MCRLAWSVVLLAACGRENFDDAGMDDSGSGSNAMTGDFDGDEIDNAVDNCPHAFNQNQTDTDGDGVGDGCDPRPNVAGDRLVAIGLFDNSFGDFVPDSVANWSRTAFPGFVTTTAATDSTLARLSLTATAPTPTLQFSFVIRDYGALVTDQVKLKLSNYPNFECMADGQTSFIDEIVILVNSSGATAVGINSVPAGALTLMSGRASTGGFACTVGGTTHGTGYTNNPTDSVMATIEVEGSQVSIGHAALYGVF